MNLFRIFIVSTLVCLIAAGCSDSSTPKTAENNKKKVLKPLICHVGGTMRPVIEQLAEKYEKKTGRKIEINSADSGELLAYIELQKEGDIYICHDPFMDILMNKKLGIDSWVIAELVPVIIVQKGNPKHIKDLRDLTRDDVELFLTDYKHSTLGRMLPTIFSKAGIDFAELNRKKEINTNKSGGYTANMVKTKNADAGMVWGAVAYLRRDGLDTVSIDKYLPTPYVDMVTSATKKSYKLTPVRVSVSTLKCSEQPEEAAKFAAFLASDEAASVLKRFGYKVDPDITGRTYINGKQK